MKLKELEKMTSDLKLQIREEVIKNVNLEMVSNDNIIMLTVCVCVCVRASSLAFNYSTPL